MSREIESLEFRKAAEYLTFNRYDKLPKYEEKSNYAVRFIGRTLSGTFSILYRLTVIGPFVKVLFTTFVTIPNASKFSVKLLNYETLNAIEKRTQDMARRAGIIQPEHIKLIPSYNTRFVAALGTSVIYINPSYLVRPQDLPEDLKIERVNNGEISEAMWAAKFNKWIETFNITSPILEPWPNQFHVDYAIKSGILILDRLKNFKEGEKCLDAILGHELGHCKYNDSLKTIWIRFAIELLSVPTLGVASFFEDRMLAFFLQKQEKQADLFSAKTLKCAAGLTQMFQQINDTGKDLHKKYKEIYTAEGNNLEDIEHPTPLHRISYLRPYIQNDS